MDPSPGLGLDLVKVGRIEKISRKWGDRFLARVFTSPELDYCLSRRRKYQHLAGRFAAKEAVMKALGRRLPWTSLEILSRGSGKPAVRFCPEKQAGEGAGRGKHLLVSITHTEDHAAANAIYLPGGD